MHDAVCSVNAIKLTSHSILSVAFNREHVPKKIGNALHFFFSFFFPAEAEYS